jgi:hypothetical protein
VFWTINSFPRCTHHVFLSHCREDHDTLVRPIHEQLRERDVASWLDREDYYYGRDSRTALRDGVLRSRHAVFFVTPAMLGTGRGWCIFELAFAELLQGSLARPGGVLANVALPLFFLPPSDPVLPRTVWQAVRDRGRFHSPADGDPVAWSVREIVRFLRDEQRIAADHAAVARSDSAFRKELRERAGLVSRVTAFDPQPIPETD